jgi:hypothetical protein
LEPESEYQSEPLSASATIPKEDAASLGSEKEQEEQAEEEDEEERKELFEFGLEDETISRYSNSDTNELTPLVEDAPILCDAKPGRPHNSHHNRVRINGAAIVVCVGGPVGGTVRAVLYRGPNEVSDSGEVPYSFIDGKNDRRAYANVNCEIGIYRVFAETVENFPPNYHPGRSTKRKFSQPRILKCPPGVQP